MARIATKTDSTALIGLYDLIKPTIENVSAKSIPSWVGKEIERFIDSEVEQLYIEPPDTAFFLTIKRELPEGKFKGTLGSELNCWGVQPTATNKLSSLKNLFDLWFSEHKGEVCWGLSPDIIPQASKDILKYFADLYGWESLHYKQKDVEGGLDVTLFWWQVPKEFK